MLPKQTEATCEAERLPAGHLCPIASNIEPRLKAIEDMVTEIRTAMVGNIPLGHVGLVGRQDHDRVELAKLAAKVDAIDRKLITWAGIATGASVVLSYLKVKLFGS